MEVPAVEVAFRSDPGRDPDKQINEDAAVHGETPYGWLALVCDGMGGHAGGKEAAELAVRTVADGVAAAPLGTSPRDALRAALEEANRCVWEMSTTETGAHPGATAVALLVHPFGTEVAHVGDSRAYLIHSGAISQLTRDHSMVQEMVVRGLLKPEDADIHPDANKIMRALGIAKSVEVEVRTEAVAHTAGDVFVLCSDGLSDLVGAASILEIAGSRPAAQAAGELVELANARGGHDNITVLIVRVKATASPTDHATVAKTVALTELAAPVETVAVARRTVLATPMHAPPAVQQVPRPAAMPSVPESRSIRPWKSVPVLVTLVVCVAVGLATAGWFLWQARRPQHRFVPLVIRDSDLPQPTSTESAEAPSVPEIPPAPTLAPPEGPAPGDGIGDCARARWQREHGHPLPNLEAKCRARGGSL